MARADINRAVHATRPSPLQGGLAQTGILDFKIACATWKTYDCVNEQGSLKHQPLMERVFQTSRVSASLPVVPRNANPVVSRNANPVVPRNANPVVPRNANPGCAKER